MHPVWEMGRCTPWAVHAAHVLNKLARASEAIVHSTTNNCTAKMDCKRQFRFQHLWIDRSRCRPPSQPVLSYVLIRDYGIVCERVRVLPVM